MTKVFTIYRPIIGGIDDINFFGEKVSEELGLDDQEKAKVKWGISPRVAAFSALGELAEFLSAKTPLMGREVSKSVPSLEASTRLWGKDLDDGNYPQICLAHDRRRGGVDANPLISSPAEAGLQRLLVQAREMGIRVSPGISKRANGMDTFRPFPILSARSVSRDELEEYRRTVPFSEMPVLKLGEARIAVQAEIDDDNYWPNFGVIPESRF